MGGESGDDYHRLPAANDIAWGGGGGAGEECFDDDDEDASRLLKLGYKQELRRNLSPVANFAVSFSIISIMTGISTMYSTGLGFGGPVTMVYGWPVVGCMTLVVGLAMAEICSAYPTSGGLYFWSYRLCGSGLGPTASWFTGW